MHPTEKLRLFLALSVPENVQAELLRLQQQLKPLLPLRAGHWTKPEQFHLTLKFLGHVPAADVAAIGEAAGAVCAETPPLRLRAEGTGFFPSPFSPPVFWVDIKSPDNALLAFQRRLEDAIGRFAEKPESKKFIAHVTLARLEKMRRSDAEKFAAQAKTGRFFGEWTAVEVKLMESQLRPTGAIHATLASYRTKKD